jgi:thymidylate synthase
VFKLLAQYTKAESPPYLYVIGSTHLSMLTADHVQPQCKCMCITLASNRKNRLSPSCPKLETEVQDKTKYMCRLYNMHIYDRHTDFFLLCLSMQKDDSFFCVEL